MNYTNSNKANDILMDVMKKVEQEVESKEKIRFPKNIVWLLGPLNGGKTALSEKIAKKLNYSEEIIKLRDIFTDVITENNGKLIMENIIEKLIRTLLKYGTQDIEGVVVDEFQSVTIARTLPFLYDYINKLSGEYESLNPIQFKFALLNVTLETSIDRAKNACSMNDKEFDHSNTTKLYKKFMTRTDRMDELLKMFFEFQKIDANGTLGDVFDLTINELSSEKNGSYNNRPLKDALVERKYRQYGVKKNIKNKNYNIRQSKNYHNYDNDYRNKNRRNSYSLYNDPGYYFSSRNESSNTMTEDYYYSEYDKNYYHSTPSRSLHKNRYQSQETTIGYDGFENVYGNIEHQPYVIQSDFVTREYQEYGSLQPLSNQNYYESNCYQFTEFNSKVIMPQHIFDEDYYPNKKPDNQWIPV